MTFASIDEHAQALSAMKSKLRKQFKRELAMRQGEYDHSLQEASLKWKEKASLHEQQYVSHLQELQQQMTNMTSEREDMLMRLDRFQTILSNKATDHIVEVEKHDMSIDTSDIMLDLSRENIAVTATTSTAMMTEEEEIKLTNSLPEATVSSPSQHQKHSMPGSGSVDSSMTMISIEDLNTRLKEVNSVIFTLQIVN